MNYLSENNFTKFRFSESKFLVIIIINFIAFSTIYSLYTPTWEESDGWFHWFFIKSISEGKFEPLYYERQAPLYYAINAMFLSFFDPVSFSDSSPPLSKKNFYEDFNYFRHISEDEFKYGNNSDATFITLENESNFDFDRTDSYSFAAWIKPDVTRSQHLFDKRSATDGGYVFFLDSGNEPAFFTSANSGNRLYVKADYGISTDAWQHVAITYDGSSTPGGIRIYVNGSLVSTRTVNDSLTSGSILNDGTPTIGARFDSSGFMNGKMDTLRIYDYELTADQISNFGTTPEPIALYNFDGDVLDSSGNANHGIVSGTITYKAGKDGNAFDFKGSDFQRGCEGYCTGLSEEFPYEGIALGVHSLRFISIFFGIITLVFVYKISKLIFVNNKWLIFFPVSFVSLIPQFVFINSVLASESLAITTCTIVVYYLLKFVKNPNNNKFLILIGIFTGISLITKVNTVFLIPVIFSTFLYVFYIHKLQKRKFLKIIVIFILVFIAFGGWWYIINPSNSLTILIDISLLDIFDNQENENEFTSNTENSKFNNLIDFERHHFVYFESMWGNIGWKAIKTDLYLIDVIKIILVIGLSGLILSALTKFNIQNKQVDKNYLVVLILVIVFMTLSVLFLQYHSGRGTGRNLLPAVAGFSILFSLGFYFLVGRQRLKPLLFVPIAFLIFVNVGLFFEMNEKFEHGLPRDPIHDLNHDLRTEIWLGKGTLPQGSEPDIRLRNAWLEDGKRDTILLIHPPKTGNSWWNFTMNLPEDSKYDLEITYGFASNAKGRTDPVEFTAYIENEMVLQEMKSFDGKVEKIKINLEEYGEDRILVSLSTDAKDYGHNKSWSFYKIKFIR